MVNCRVKLARQGLVNKSIMMYKIVNNMVPGYFSSLFVVQYDTLTFNLREIERSLSCSGNVLWNSLPLDIRQLPSLNEFKSKLNSYDF